MPACAVTRPSRSRTSLASRPCTSGLPVDQASRTAGEACEIAGLHTRTGRRRRTTANAAQSAGPTRDQGRPPPQASLAAACISHPLYRTCASSAASSSPKTSIAIRQRRYCASGGDRTRRPGGDISRGHANHHAASRKSAASGPQSTVPRSSLKPFKFVHNQRCRKLAAFCDINLCRSDL